MTYLSKKLIRTAVIVSVFAAGALAAHGQIAQTSAPREDRLLNGLRLLVWSDPKSAKVSIKTRIHSGSAFDPLGKEGTMKLLSDIIFPGDTTREYFRDDLGGDLKVTCTYDYIEIDASGDADKFLQIVETLSQALTNPVIDKETTGRVKSPQLALLAELEKNPNYVANAAAAKRLFGSYPYGRPMQGTTASVSAIDFADVLFAKQRFFTADNATVAIVGNVKSDFAFRAVKRLFGGWLKADKKIPATFAAPEPASAQLQILDTAVPSTSEFRMAVRGVARKDKNYFAHEILERILARRLKSRDGNSAMSANESHLLSGMMIFGASSWNGSEIKRNGSDISLPADINNYQDHFLKSDINNDEFNTARAEVVGDYSKQGVDDLWLDAETYRLTSAKDDLAAVQAVTLADIQKSLERLRSETFVRVLVVTAEQPAGAQ